MFVSAKHPRVPHQLWEVPAGQTVRYGVITPPVGEQPTPADEWTWSPLLTAAGIPAMEVWVNGEPAVYTDGPDSEGKSDNPPGRHYFIKYATWWDPTKAADVTVITGTDGDIYVMGDNGRTIDKVA